MPNDSVSGTQFASTDFEALFKGFPGLVLILLPDDIFTIAAMTDSYSQRSMQTQSSTIGRGVFEVFSDDPNDPKASGVETLRNSLNRVRLTKDTDSMQLQKYSVKNLKGEYEVAYWSVQNSPVLDTSGDILYIVHQVQDVTEYVNFKAQSTPNSQAALAAEPISEIESEVYLRALAIQKANERLRDSEATLLETKELLLKQLYERTDALEQASERTQMAMDAASLGEWEFDFKSGKTFRNLRHARCFGYEDATREWSHSIFLDHVHPEDRDEIQKIIQDAVDTHSILEYECRVLWPDQSLHWITGRAKVRYDANGIPLQLVGIVSDITTRKLREEALARSENNIRSLLNSTAEGIWGIDLHGRITFINEAAVKLCGYDSKDQLIGQISHNFMQHTRPDGSSYALIDGPEYKAYHEGLACHREKEIIWRADGTSFLADYRVTPVIEHNRIVGAVVSFTDITDQELARSQTAEAWAAVENERENFRLLFRQTPEMVCMLSGPDHVFEFVNDAHAIALGFDATGMNVRTAQPESVEVHGILDDVYRTGITACLREIPVTVGSKLRYFNLTYAPRKAASGEVSGVMILGSEITQQIEAREAIIRAKEDADAANHSKTAFIANMSHEIRTPIGIIIGFSELLQDPNLSAFERQDYLERVVKNTKGLTRIIDDILDLAKVEAGKLEVEAMKFPLIELVQETMDLFQDRAKEKKIDFKLRHEALKSQLIYSDPTRIRQILVNIIGNAIKFTSGGSVTVTLNSERERSGRNKLLIRVKDTGIGLSENQIDKLFQPFVQADGSTNRLFGGTGLGLVISRRLAFALGGSIDIEDSKLGEGCTFRITLFDADKGLPSDSSEPIENEFSKQFEKARPTSLGLIDLKILVAEDSLDNQMLVKRILTKQGALVELANNGEEAVLRGHSEVFDLILMDVQMPKMDGYEATRTLRKAGFKTPIIALTAHAMLEEKERTREAGCDAHLTKPINAPLLIETIKDLTGR